MSQEKLKWVPADHDVTRAPNGKARKMLVARWLEQHMIDTMYNVGARISEAEFARRLGVSPPMLNRWMLQRLSISPLYLAQIATALDDFSIYEVLHEEAPSEDVRLIIMLYENLDDDRRDMLIDFVRKLQQVDNVNQITVQVNK